MRWHGRYECIAPVEVLHYFVDLLHGILATQNAATDLLALVHQVLEAPLTTDHLHCIFYRMGADVYPSAVKTMPIGAYLTESLQPFSGTLQAPARRMLISKIPVYGMQDSAVKWIPYE